MSILGKKHNKIKDNFIFNDNVVLIDPLQDPHWDKFVDNHPYGWITHLSGWKYVLEKSFKQLKGHYLVLLNDDNESYKAALPLYEVSSLLTGNRLISIPFATLSDPLITDNTELEKLITASQLLQKKLKSGYIEVRAFNTSPTFGDARLVPQSLYKHHYIDLETNQDIMNIKFHRSCVRQRINRANKSEISFIIGTDEHHLKQFYQLYILSRKRLLLPPQPYVFFKLLFETFSPSGKLSLMLAELHGQIVAGLILFKYKDRVSAEYSVLNEAFQNASPNHFLFWEAIKSASVEGYKVFDFGRTAPSNITLMNFKSRWGTKVSDIRHFEYPGSKSMGINKEQTKRYKIMRDICRIAPDCVFQLMGNFCYRHLY
jgi:hypothetical protein